MVFRDKLYSFTWLKQSYVLLDLSHDSVHDIFLLAFQNIPGYTADCWEARETCWDETLFQYAIRFMCLNLPFDKAASQKQS